MKKLLVLFFALASTAFAQLGDLVIVPAGGGASVSYPIAVDKGGSGTNTLAGLRSVVGLPQIQLSDYLPANPETTDCSTAFANALAATPEGGVLVMPANTRMAIDNPTQWPNKHITLVGYGDSTILTNRQAYGVPIFYVNGTTGGATNITLLATAATLASDSEAGSCQVTVTDASGIVAGNVYCLWDNGQEFGSGYYRAEMVRVHSITNTTTLILDASLTRNHYTASSAKLAAVQQNNYVMMDFVVDGAANSGQGVSFIYGGYTYGSIMRRIKFNRVGYSSSSRRYESDFLVDRCEFIGAETQDPAQGYADFWVTSSRVTIQNCTMRQLQWMTFEHSVECQSLNNIGLQAGTVGWHGGNRKCRSIGDRISAGTAARGSNPNAAFVADRSVDTTFIDCMVTKNNSQGFSIGVQGAETNIVILNCVVQGSEQSAAAGEPETTTSNGAIQLTTVNGATIDGLYGQGVTGGITLTACTGDIVIRNVRLQMSTTSSAAVRLATTTSSSANLRLENIWCSRLIYDEASSMSVNTLVIRNCYSPYCLKWAIFKTSRNTEGANILEISGAYGSYNAVSSLRWSPDYGMAVWTPSALNTAFISDSGYSTALAPGRGAGSHLLYRGYASTASGNVNVVLAHDVGWVTAGRELTVINGDATTSGSTTPNLPIKENGTTIFTFPTNTQNAWVKLRYAGVTNYWDGGSLNWKVVAASPNLGFFRKVGTVTIAADGTVTNTFSIPFQTGVTPLVTVTPTVSAGGTNYFVTSSDNTMFKMTGPIGVTFNYSASNGDN